MKDDVVEVEEVETAGISNTEANHKVWANFGWINYVLSSRFYCAFQF